MNIFKPHKEDKLRVRRGIAITSFISILLTLVFCLVMVMLGTPQMVTNITSLQGLISTIMVFLTGLVGGYFHNSHTASG